MTARIEDSTDGTGTASAAETSPVVGHFLVDLESLTLSRDVPALIRPIAAPLVARIARESVVRTLDAFRRFFSTKDTGDT